MIAIDKELIKRNIFYKAYPVVDVFPKAKWHKNRNKQIDADNKYSSQALAIDVFGTLRECKDKDIIINYLFNTQGENWEVDFEFDDKTLLNESKYPTQIDVKLESKNKIILFECKFTENDGGACSQPKANNSQKKPQCNGNYELQINPINNKKSFCALSAKDIKYWDYIAKTYNLDVNNPIIPCPFKGGEYQWMRNVCLGCSLGEREKKEVKVYICYADFPSCPIKKKMDKGYLNIINSNLRENYHISTITYQAIIEAGIKLSTGSEHSDWLNLRDWIQNKGE